MFKLFFILEISAFIFNNSNTVTISDVTFMTEFISNNFNSNVNSIESSDTLIKLKIKISNNSENIIKIIKFSSEIYGEKIDKFPFALGDNKLLNIIIPKNSEKYIEYEFAPKTYLQESFYFTKITVDFNTEDGNLLGEEIFFEKCFAIPKKSAFYEFEEIFVLFVKFLLIFIFLYGIGYLIFQRFGNYFSKYNFVLKKNTTETKNINIDEWHPKKRKKDKRGN